jgi:hypothetical protein
MFNSHVYIAIGKYMDSLKPIIEVEETGEVGLSTL